MTRKLKNIPAGGRGRREEDGGAAPGPQFNAFTRLGLSRNVARDACAPSQDWNLVKRERHEHDHTPRAATYFAPGDNSIVKEEPVSDEETTDPSDTRIGTLNMRGARRRTGGLDTAVSQIELVMTTKSLDILIVTELNLVGWRELTTSLRRRGIDALISCPENHNDQGTGHGSGVGIVWRTGKLTVGDQRRDVIGRMVSVTLLGAHRRILLIGAYGVADPSHRRDEADALWAKVAVRTRDFRDRYPQGGYIVGGDFNAVLDVHRDRREATRHETSGLWTHGDNAADESLLRLTTDLHLTDAASCPHVHDSDALAFSWLQNGEDTALNRRASARLDRFYVGSGDGWLESTVTSLTGTDREVCVPETDHGLVQLTLAHSQWKKPPPPLHKAPTGLFKTAGAGEHTHTRRSTGVPTFLRHADGTAASDTVTVQWMLLHGFSTHHLVDATALRGDKWIGGWLANGCKPGGLSAARWAAKHAAPPPPHGPIDPEVEQLTRMIGGNDTATEAWVRWLDERTAALAVSTGAGWPTLVTSDDTPVHLSISTSPGEITDKLHWSTLHVHAHNAEGDENVPHQVSKKVMTRYLAECHAPPGIKLRGVGTGCAKTGYADWVASATPDTEPATWLARFGARPNGAAHERGLPEGLQMYYAVGWTRFDDEMARGAAIQDYASACASIQRAAKLAFGKDEGKKHGTAWKRVLEAAADLRGAIRVVKSHKKGALDTNNRLRRVVDHIPYSPLRDTARLYLGATTTNEERSAAGRDLAATLRSLEEEMVRATRSWKSKRQRDYAKDTIGAFTSGRSIGEYVRLLLRPKGSRGGAVAPRDDDGLPIGSTADRIDAIEKEYREWCPPVDTSDWGNIQWYKEVMKEKRWIPKHLWDALEQPVTKEDTRETMRGTGGSAPGPSGITRKMWARSGDAILTVLTELYNTILRTGEWPPELLLGLIHPICKREGLCFNTNARPITLLETALKGLTRILQKRIRTILAENPVLEASQLAFLPGADIFDNIEVDSFLWEDLEGQELHVGYCDGTAAFDSQQLKLTADSLHSLRMSGKTVRLLVALDEVHDGRRVNTEEGLTGWITFPGMAQGEVLSPIKFVVNQDGLARWLADEGRGVTVRISLNGVERAVRVVALQFCDDLNVYARSREDLQHNLGIVAEWCRVTGLRINGPKSCYCSSSAPPGTVPDWSPTLKGVWHGGRNGYFVPSDGPEGRLRPVAADEAVRTLGVWRAASGCVAGQAAAHAEAIRKVEEALTRHARIVTPQSAKYILNNVLAMQLEYAMRDAGQWGGGSKGGDLVSRATAAIRRLYRNAVGLQRSTGIPILHADTKDGGHGLVNFEDLVTRNLIARSLLVLHTPSPVQYWSQKRDSISAIDEEDRTIEQNYLLAEAERRMHGTTGLSHFLLHKLLSNAATRTGASDGNPLAEHGKPETGPHAHNRIGVLQRALQHNGCGIESWRAIQSRGRESTGAAQGRPLSALLPPTLASAINQTLRNENLFYQRDVLAKDGIRIATWYTLQLEQRIVTCSGGPREWYLALREELCADTTTAVVKEEYSMPPVVPDPGEFALCWEYDSEIEDRVSNASKGAHLSLRDKTYMREPDVIPVVRVLEVKGRFARVIRWNRTTTNRTFSTHHRAMPGEGHGRWVASSRLSWMAHSMQPGSNETWCFLEFMDGDWPRLLRHAEHLSSDSADQHMDAERADDDASLESMSQHSDLGAHWKDIVTPPGFNEARSDGAFYPATSAGGTAKAGYASATYNCSTDKVTTRSEPLENGGVRACMQYTSASAEAAGLLSALRTHNKNWREGRCSHTTIVVDCKSMVERFRHIHRVMRDPKLMSKMSDRNIWMSIGHITSDPTFDKESVTVMWQPSHVGEAGNDLVDRLAKLVSRDSATTNRVEWTELHDLEHVATVDGYVVRDPIKKVLKAKRAEEYSRDIAKLTNQGRRLAQLRERKGSLAPALATSHGVNARHKMRALTSTLPDAVHMHRWKPALYTTATCLVCGTAPETTAHWLQQCTGHNGEAATIRKRIHDTCEAILAESLDADAILAAPWRNNKAGRIVRGMHCTQPIVRGNTTTPSAWTRAGGILLHTAVGEYLYSLKRDPLGTTRIRHPDETRDASDPIMREAAVWRLLDLWEGDDENGAELAKEMSEVVSQLTDGSVGLDGTVRRERDCWATPDSGHALMESIFGATQTQYADVLNMKDTSLKVCVGHDPGRFGGFGAVQFNGLELENTVDKYIFANPPYDSAEARAANREDFITKQIKLMPRAARGILWIPARAGGSYRRDIGTHRGIIVHEFVEGSVRFNPASHWRGGHAFHGAITERMVLALFNTPRADARLGPVDPARAKLSLDAWWRTQQDAHTKRRCNELTTVAASNGLDHYPIMTTVPPSLCFWNSDRGEDGFDRSYLDDITRGAFSACRDHNSELGALGYAPRDYKRCLTSFGLTNAEAKDCIKRLEEVLSQGEHELWLTRCGHTTHAEAALGITKESKRSPPSARRAPGATPHREPTLPVVGIPPTRLRHGAITKRWCPTCGAQNPPTAHRKCTTCGERMGTTPQHHWNPCGLAKLATEHNPREIHATTQAVDIERDFWHNQTNHQTREGDTTLARFEWLNVADKKVGDVLAAAVGTTSEPTRRPKRRPRSPTPATAPLPKAILSTLHPAVGVKVQRPSEIQGSKPWLGTVTDVTYHDSNDGHGTGAGVTFGVIWTRGPLQELENLSGESLRHVIRYPTRSAATSAMEKRSALIRGCQLRGHNDSRNYVVRPHTTPTATTHYGKYLVRAVYPGGGVKMERYSDEIEVWENLVVNKAGELSRADVARRTKRKTSSECGQTPDDDTDPDEPTPKWASREDVRDGALTRQRGWDGRHQATLRGGTLRAGPNKRRRLPPEVNVIPPAPRPHPTTTGDTTAVPDVPGPDSVVAGRGVEGDMRTRSPKRKRRDTEK